ncbi:MAG: adenylosuccinate synthetase [Patescibacteria group bacterium]
MKVYTFTDLGPGDGGKGGVIDKVCHLTRAHTVLKVGGAQGSHGVRTSAGQSFNFKQFGCGTFRGAKTHITELMIIEPFNLIEEGRALQQDFCLVDIFNDLTIDEQALCITPFHYIASQLRELDRKDKPKGTIGMGAGEAKNDSEIYPELAIRAKDFTSPLLKEKLVAVKNQKLQDLEEIINRLPEFYLADQEHAQKLLTMLNDEELIDHIVQTYQKLASLVKIVDRNYLRTILQQDGTVVVESSHGALTDYYYGFSPHTSRLRTLPEFTWDLLNECDYDGQVIKLAVHRAYQIRHGAGPMVTESKEWLEKMLPGSSKMNNRWQGDVRIGPLDLVAMKYALEACGGTSAFDGLALTWFDQIQTIGQWQVCSSYQNTGDTNFFSETGNIKIKHLSCSDQLIRQKQLTEQLFNCRPNVDSYDLSGKSQKELIQFTAKFLFENLKVPLKMISFGPTEADKICL